MHTLDWFTSRIGTTVLMYTPLGDKHVRIESAAHADRLYKFHKNSDMQFDELPEIDFPENDDSTPAGVRKIHVGGSTCESCEG